MKTRFLSFLTVLVLVFSWAGLIFVHWSQQKNILTEKEQQLQTQVNLMAVSINEFLSLKVDYNRDSLEEVYLQEILAGMITPMESYAQGVMWIVRDERVYQTENPLFLLSKNSFELEQLFSKIKQQPSGLLTTDAESGKASLLHAWTVVQTGGYEWTVGVSVSTAAVLENAAWLKVFGLLIWVYVGATLLFFALLIWANSW